MLSSYGLMCETCYAFPKDCPGCDNIEGKPSWVSDIGKSVCELYQCARDRGLTSCGGCAALPCRQWADNGGNCEIPGSVWKSIWAT
ncbi:MAG TPA: hypothetical protein DEQ54_04075 [Firmicutes bacterium]|nr:DUF3795 domain-containing protein [Bacillota bacterium]HCD41785.1 hypothetical protein [Bacillota bacterium]